VSVFFSNWKRKPERNYILRKYPETGFVFEIELRKG